MVNGSIRVQTTQNGATVTLASLGLAQLTGTPTAPATANQTVSISFNRPIKMDPGTALNFVVVNPDGYTDVFSCGTVHLTTELF